MKSSSNLYPRRYYQSQRMDSPEVILDIDECVFKIAGNSYPANPEAIYRPILEWFLCYLDEILARGAMEIIFNFNYINTSTYKFLMELFYLFNTKEQSKDLIFVRWLYMDGDTENKELAESFEDKVTFNFEKKPY